MNIVYAKPFKVRIIQDCRKTDRDRSMQKLDGHYGICLGMYNYPKVWEKARGEEGNPLILTDTGEYIWGIECWWDPNPEETKDIPLDLQQRVLELHKANIRRQGADPNLN